MNDPSSIVLEFHFREWAEEDEIDVEDLPIWDPRRPKKGMDTTKLDGRDHVTTWSESNKGKQFGLYVTIVPGKLDYLHCFESGLWS